MRPCAAPCAERHAPFLSSRSPAQCLHASPSLASSRGTKRSQDCRVAALLAVTGGGSTASERRLVIASEYGLVIPSENGVVIASEARRSQDCRVAALLAVTGGGAPQANANWSSQGNTELSSRAKTELSSRAKRGDLRAAASLRSSQGRGAKTSTRGTTRSLDGQARAAQIMCACPPRASHPPTPQHWGPSAFGCLCPS